MQTEEGETRILKGLKFAFCFLPMRIQSSERKLTELTDDGFTSPGHADLLFYRKSRLDS